MVLILRISMDTEENKTSKLIIIGSGPAGLTAAIYAARAELKPLVMAGHQPGGQLTITTDVENFPGFPEGIQGPELMMLMQKQAEKFGSVIVQESAVKLDLSTKPFVVSTDRAEYKTQALIIATGAEVKWLGLPNEQRLRGKGVTACATCDGFFFKGLEVAVIGGGDSAMEEATFLTKFATKVYIVHRRSEFKASKIMLERAKANEKIEFLTPFEVVDVLGDSSLSAIKLKNTESGEEKELPVGGMFLAIGHAPATKIFAEAGVEVNEQGYILQKKFTETSVEGVFVAGDVHDHRYRQAITSAGWGCAAALDAEKWLAENILNP